VTLLVGLVGLVGVVVAVVAAVVAAVVPPARLAPRVDLEYLPSFAAVHVVHNVGSHV